ncbi:hypothetical protein, partial [Glutamicibacter sp. NPDC087344]|uniref:hypothetical protein n=1 Tax=Glutamicibacter sp. NPDC087344 TaxID=3363994 RepID=UPI0037FD4507
MATAVFAGGIVVSVPTAAFAADPFPSSKLYGTNQKKVYEVDPATGVTKEILAPTVGGSNTLNQIGIASGGDKVVFTSQQDIYIYTASAETWTQIPRTDGMSSNFGGNTMGGVDVATDTYLYGGAVANGSDQFEYASLNVNTQDFVPNALSVTLPGTPGGNGDLAFDAQGNLFIVTGGSTSAQLYRINAADVKAGGQVTGTKVGSEISNVVTTNSMAFGADGYLYLYATNGLLKVDPASGTLVSIQPLSGDTSALTDLASWSSPSTAGVNVDLPSGRVDPEDQFAIELTGGGITENNTAETTGDEPGVQDQEDGESIGATVVIPGNEYTITQTGIDETDLEKYTTTWQCVDLSNGEVFASGEGNSGTFTLPQGSNATNIQCTFTNNVSTPPEAADDESLNNERGPVTVEVLGNDSEGLDPST